jgi:hypothetical protein
MFSQFKSEQYDLYRSESQFDDITRKFFDFLKTQKDKADATFTIMIMGMKRSGKTLTAMMIIETLMMSDPSRYLVLFKCPKALFDELNKVYPSRVKFAKTLIDCDVQNAIIYTDEGLIGLNAKLALTKELREFGQALAYTSHKRIVMLLNAQDDGVMRDLRTKCEIVIYKRLSRFFLNDCKDSILYENRNFLMKLDRIKHLVIGNFFDFTEMGILRVKKEDCKFWSESLSHNMQNISLSTEFQKQKDNATIIEECSNEILKILKKRALRVKLSQFIQFHYKKKNLEFFMKIQPMIADIAINIYGKAVLKYQMGKQGDENEDNENDDNESESIITESEIKFDDTFAVFALMNFPKLDKKNEIFYLLLSGSTQRSICDNLGLSLTKVNQAIQTISEKEIGYYFEDYFSLKHNGDSRGYVAHEKPEPDFIDSDGNVYSLKYRYCRDNSITFYQSTDCNPEITYCREKGIKQFSFVLFNPRWTEKQVVRLIRLDDPDKIILRK